MSSEIPGLLESTFGQKTPMRTATGEPIWVLEPEKTTVRWFDLKTALSNQRRYHGFLDWTIAQHLALCTRLAINEPDTYAEEEEIHDGMSLDEKTSIYRRRAEMIAAAAAHDLQEAYVMDLPKGLKECCPNYQVIENRWEKHVHESLGLKHGVFTDFVKKIDLRALAIELQLLGWEGWEPAEELLASQKPIMSYERKMFQWIREASKDEVWEIIQMSIEGGMEK